MKKSHFALGGILAAVVLFLVLGAAAPAPVQRNQWTTNVQGQPIIGDFIISNSVAANGTNFILFSWQGITSLAPGPRQLWKLYGWMDGGPAHDSVLDWFGSSSHLSTNGGIVISAHNIDLNPDGAALFVGSISNTILTASRAVVTDANKVLTSATGTPNGFKFLRDDNSYAVPAGTSEAPFNYQSIPGLALQVDGDGLTNGLRITTWAGYGLALTSTPSASPSVITSALTGRVGAFFDQTNYLTFFSSNNNNMLNTNCTIFIAFEATNRWGLGYRYLLGGNRTQLQFGDGIDGEMANDFTVWLDSNSGLHQPANYFHQYFPASASNTVSAVASFLYEQGALTWPKRLYAGINEFVSPLTYTNAMIWPRLGICTLGAYPGSPTSSTFGFAGIIYEFVVYTNAISIDQYNGIQKYLQTKYKARTQPYFMADGDAGFIGGGMGTDEKAVAPVFHEINYSMLAHNSSINASTVRTLGNIMDAATNLVGGTLKKAYSPVRSDNLYMLYYGSQAIVQGTNGTTVWQNASNCMWTAKAQGFIVPVFTLHPGGSNDAERVTFNNAAKTYWPIVGSILCDITELPNTSATDTTNGQYYVYDTVNGYMPTSYQSSIFANFITSRLRQVCSANLIPR